MDNYSSILLNATNGTIVEEVCNGNTTKICCQFIIKITVDQSLSSTADRSKYTYHLAAFNGVRSFSGIRDGE
ncbi:hypothetical protein NQ314_007090 [Rhamnusium bicolor]|uniref:Vanin C-terminal domain-containing protein n=1 Tax=Rhamnusium bicolor TaxID=1586634 RepID=A0AAV8YUZ8_9CUCU|nr:hypothetical protein NQ314_007090 [Rhamnusium bicolor]